MELWACVIQALTASRHLLTSSGVLGFDAIVLAEGLGTAAEGLAMNEEEARVRVRVNKVEGCWGLLVKIGTSVAVKVGTSVAVKVGTSVAVKVGTSVAVKIGTSVAVKVGTSVAVKVGTSVAVKVGTSVAVKVGT
jgi:uncharacterized cupin superfamily protein